MIGRRFNDVPIACVVAGFATLCAIIGPVGDFPIGDDWYFGGLVRDFLLTGSLKRAAVEQPTAYVHVITGAAMAWMFGLSWTMLRLVTICHAMAFLVGGHRLLRECGASEPTAVGLVVMMAVNPLFVLFSLSFMTDVTFMAWAVWLAVWMRRALSRPSARILAIVCALSVMAILTRQVAIVMALAFVPAFVIARGWSGRSLVASGLPAASMLLAYGAFMVSVPFGGGDARYVAASAAGSPVAFVLNPALRHAVMGRLLNVLFHAGWILLPIVLWSLRRASSRAAAWRRLWLVAAPVGAVLVSGKVAPWGSTVITNLGVLVPDVRDGERLSSPLPSAPDVVWLIWTLAGAVGVGLLADALWSAAARMRESRRRGEDASRRRETLAVFMLFAGAALGMATIMVFVKFFDRYLLPTVPLVAAALVVVASLDRFRSSAWPPAVMASAALAAGMAIFSALACHDALASTRARWRVLDRLTSAGTYSVGQIDGGAQFRARYDGGWFAQRSFLSSPAVAVTVGDLPGYQRCFSETFRRWMPPRDEAVFAVVPVGKPCPR